MKIIRIVLHVLLFPAVAVGLLAGSVALAAARECRTNHFVIVGTAAVEGVPATVRIMDEGLIAWSGALSVSPVEVDYVYWGGGYFRIEPVFQDGTSFVSEFGYITKFEGNPDFIVVDHDRVFWIFRDPGAARVVMDGLSCLEEMLSR